MTQGRSIRLFLVDGSPNGLLTAEIMNWTGHTLTGPRSRLAELVKRPECSRTGVYFLVGPDPENSTRPLVYIGESEDVAQRLKQHNRPEESGGKDFWERACLVTSKDLNLTKAHIKYLESELIKQAKASGRCTLCNGNAPEFDGLPESDKSDMTFFIEQIRTVLPVLGLDFLREPATQATAQSQSEEAPQQQLPVFEFALPRHGVKARAQEIEGEFIVLAGSSARHEWIGSVTEGYKRLFDQLLADGVLGECDASRCQFTRDYAFSSPSAAAAIVSGRNANGRTSWQIEGSNQTYAAWQELQLEDVIEP